MELNFLTWNIKNNKKTKIFFEDLNAQIVKSKIDVLVLQECIYDDFISELVDFIEIDGFLKGRGIKRSVRIFLNKNSNIDYNSSTAYANNKLRCVELKISDGFVFNLIGAHLYSKTRKSDGQQLFDNKDIPRFIEEFELKKTQNSIIIGDLNYKPFELSMAHPDFLNTTGDKNIIDLFKTRSVKARDGNDKKVRFLYNPMWNLLGDYDYNKTQKPSGTYYWYPDDVEKFHWNLIDGVLLSPSIMNNIIVDSIKILSEMNGKKLIKSTITKTTESLLTSGFSDHLPVSFTLKTT